MLAGSCIEIADELQACDRIGFAVRQAADK